MLDLVGVADVVVENAVAGTWERQGLDEDQLARGQSGPRLRPGKGIRSARPTCSPPAFDYVVQAATGMEMTQGRDHPQPVNFTANDYGTGMHLAAGIVLGLLARARGVAVTRRRVIAHDDGNGVPVRTGGVPSHVWQDSRTRWGTTSRDRPRRPPLSGRRRVADGVRRHHRTAELSLCAAACTSMRRPYQRSRRPSAP